VILSNSDDGSLAALTSCIRSYSLVDALGEQPKRINVSKTAKTTDFTILFKSNPNGFSLGVIISILLFVISQFYAQRLGSGAVQSRRPLHAVLGRIDYYQRLKMKNTP
jgi:hypothetical protein